MDQDKNPGDPNLGGKTVLIDGGTPSGQDTGGGVGASTVALTPKQQKLEARSRLDGIVADGLKAIDDLVSNTPTRLRARRREARFYMADSLYMSGALLWDPTPDQIKEEPVVLGAVEDPQASRASSRRGAVKSISSSDQTVTPSPSHSSSDLVSSARSNRKRKSVNGSNNESSGSAHIEPGTQRPPRLQARHQPSRQAKARNNWGRTSVPAPEPWKELGIPSPFAGERPRTTSP